MFRTVAPGSAGNLYVDKNVGLGIPGTTVTAADKNVTQEELANFIELNGLVLDGTGVNDHQVYDAGLELIKETIPAALTASGALAVPTKHTIVKCDPGARAFTVTLPDAATSVGYKIAILVTTTGGTVTVERAGADTIRLKNIVATSFPLHSVGSYIILFSDGSTTWRTLGCYSRCDSGSINTNDWTNRDLGSMQVTYNAGAGAFIVGETITESVSGVTGIIQANTGAVLTLKNVTGVGFFTNARTITGSTSGCARTVNGTTKNLDSTFLHDFTSMSSLLKIQVLSSPGVGFAGLHLGNNDVSQEGVNLYGGSLDIYTSTTTSNYNTATHGLIQISGAGTSYIIDTQDNYYRLLAEVTI